MKEMIVVLDIGTTKISMTYGEINKEGELSISGYEEVIATGLSNGVIVNIDKTVEEILLVKKKLEKFIGIHVDKIYLLLSGNICSIYKNRGMIAISSEEKEITPNDIKRVIDVTTAIPTSKHNTIIGVDPYEYVVDGIRNVSDPIGMIGHRLELKANIIMSKTSIITNLEKVVEKSGLKVLGRVLQPISISNIILRREKVNYVTSIVDVGGESTGISIFEGSNLVDMYTIPLGGKNITKDIGYFFKLSFNTAEAIKKSLIDFSVGYEEEEEVLIENSFHEKVPINKSLLNDVAYDRVEEILNMIKDSFKRYDKPINRVVLVGGGLGEFPGIEEIIKYNLKIPCKVYKERLFDEEKSLLAPSIAAIKDEYNNYFPLKEKELNQKHEDEDVEQQEVNGKVGIVTKLRAFIDEFL